jgi:hypothetical protein
MEYFGRNLFVMNILQTIIKRKPLKTKELSPGNGEGGGGLTPQETPIMKIGEGERTRKLGNRGFPHNTIFLMNLLTHSPEPPAELQKSPLTRNQMVKLS